MIAPIIERFYSLIEKENDAKATFEEFFPACVAFAFFTREELIAFFFNLLDTDKDLILSKSELMSFVSKFRRGKKNVGDLITLYPPNVIIAIAEMRFERGDKITMIEFTKVCLAAPYFFMPMFRFQDMMRHYFGGKELWQDADVHMQHELAIQRIKKLKDDFERRRNLKVEEERTKLMIIYRERLKNYNKRFKKRQLKI